MPSLMVFAGAEASTPVLSGVVTAAMLNGVFNEIVGLLPVIVPVYRTAQGACEPVCTAEESCNLHREGREGSVETFDTVRRTGT